ncbi:hypothetical protein CBM2634_A230176 [Cupriavidus taiwanensis]|uniref:Uncharacterized protein n=1 Tax=Cupriavidus taiwanensis TaxID=164546 RepID=A0A375J372_9BURK|nr:hypothetical protein CBM2634_A230176 [Cupriavidus taiwanensis]
MASPDQPGRGLPHRCADSFLTGFRPYAQLLYKI